MKTVFLFPGLNGLIKSEDRSRFLHLPEVKQRLETVEDIFARIHKEDFKFHEFFQLPLTEIYSVDNICRAATAICAIQVGVVDHLKQKNISPDWTLGCSLGDIARAIVSGICNFEECIEGYIRFAKKLQGIETLGGNIGVSKPGGVPFTKEEIEEMQAQDLDVSCMTPKFLNIGGPFSLLEKLHVDAKAKRWRVYKILDYPAHSRYISPFVSTAALEVQHVKTYAPNTRIFSCISCKELTDVADMRNELLLNMTHPLRWGESIQTLEKLESPLRFINIGPCKSLSKMLPDLEIKSELFEIEQI